MNRKLLIVLLCVLVATSVALAACQQGGENESTACAAHTDTNKDSLCDNCGITVGFATTPTSSAGDVLVSFQVLNNNQVPMEGAEVIATDIYTGDVFTCKVGSDGTASMDLPESDYSLGVNDLPEYHVAGFQSLAVMADMDVISISVVDNTPDGSASNPFFIGADAIVKEFAADGSLCFTMRFDWGRALIIESPDVEVTVKGQTYLPDANGRVEVRLEEDNAEQTQILFTVVNKGAAQSLNLQPISDPGTMENPLVLDLGKETTAQVIDGNTLTYAWTATADGVVKVHSDTDISSLKINNLTTSTATSFTNDVNTGTGPSVTLAVKAGDQITVEVTVTTITSKDYDEVVFLLTME